MIGTRSLLSRTAAWLIVGTLAVTAPAAAGDEIHVMSSGATAPAYLALVPEFQRTTGHTLVVDAISTGLGADAIPTRVRRGDPVDVVLLSRAAVDELIKDGKVVADSRVDLARSAIGVAVRAGAPTPDVRTVDGLTRALLQAKSIAYSAQVSGVYLSTELFPRLGIADQVKAKSMRVEREPVGNVVARGEAEIGFQQISELLAVQGIRYVGPLPAEVQRVTVFSAGLVSASRHPDAARALIKFLVSPDGVRAMKKSGLEPLPADK